jgi:hypothetical protein
VAHLLILGDQKPNASIHGAQQGVDAVMHRLHLGAHRLDAAHGHPNGSQVPLERLAPPLQRLQRRDLHWLSGIGHRMLGLHDAEAGDALRRECGDGLVHQAEKRHHEQHPFALGQRTVGNGRCEDRLAGAGWSLDDRPSMSGEQCVSQTGQGEVLVGME